MINEAPNSTRTEVGLHQVAVLEGVPDWALVVGARSFQQLLEVIRWWVTSQFCRLSVDSSHQGVVAVPLVFILLFLVGWCGRTVVSFNRLLPLASTGAEHCDHSFFPIGVVGCDVEQLPSRSRLPSPDSMNQRDTCGVILQGRDDVRVLGGAGQLGASLGELSNVIM
jgi:hypothetical protein